jgi:two-component system OmpR family response regulator
MTNLGSIAQPVTREEGERTGSLLRVLHVDDDSDIREVVDIALGLDPTLSLQGCSSGGEALTTAADWHPDVILLDVMMPGMDGPTTLGHLREIPETADIPVVFMTARAQSRELDHFLSLGAAGVITKPFDPMTLAAAVREHSRAARFASRREAFVRRARKDAGMLAAYGKSLSRSDNPTGDLDAIKSLAHRLAGVAGIYGFAEISRAASGLERNIITQLVAAGPLEAVIHALDRLLALLASPSLKREEAPKEPDGPNSSPA